MLPAFILDIKSLVRNAAGFVSLKILIFFIFLNNIKNIYFLNKKII